MCNNECPMPNESYLEKIDRWYIATDRKSKLINGVNLNSEHFGSLVACCSPYRMRSGNRTYHY